ncbi:MULTISPECIES: hypothetical protein [Streptomyces]|uniref:hypothetical protein n=1 Tax=Streptomyces TaxID=1883 RepID=UPI0013016FD9|nr:hypothetical protein [Streptomyces sp. CB03578]
MDDSSKLTRWTPGMTASCTGAKSPCDVGDFNVPVGSARLQAGARERRPRV